MNATSLVIIGFFLGLSVLTIWVAYKAIKGFMKEDSKPKENDTVKIQIRAVESGIEVKNECVAEELVADPVVEEKEPVPEINAEAKRYIDSHADCWPVGFTKEKFRCGKVYNKPIGLFSYMDRPGIEDSAKNIPYEDIEKAFWSKCLELDTLIKEEHDNLHCPRGQHVWKSTKSEFYFTCEVCNYYYEKHPTTTSCAHCDQSERGPTVYSARENQLRRILWLGQKEGHIAAPVKKDSPMGFLWNRKK